MPVYRSMNLGHFGRLGCNGLFQCCHIRLYCSQLCRLVSSRFFQGRRVRLNIVQNFTVCRLRILHSRQLFVHRGQRGRVPVYRSTNLGHIFGLKRNGLCQRGRISLNPVQKLPIGCLCVLHGDQRCRVLIHHRPDAIRCCLNIREGRLDSSQRLLDICRGCFQPLQRGVLLCEGSLNVLDSLHELGQVHGIFAFSAYHILQFIRQSVHLRCDFVCLLNENSFLDAIFFSLIVVEDGILHVACFGIPCSHRNVIIGILHLCAGHWRTPRTSHCTRCSSAGEAAGLCDPETIFSRHRNAAVICARLQKHLIAVFIALCQIRILPGRLGVCRGADGVGVADAQHSLHGVDGAVNLVADFDLISQLRGRVKYRVRGRERFIFDAVQHRI